MSRKKNSVDLLVSMNESKIGILTRKPSGILRFTYEPDWLESLSPRPISLSMPLREHFYEGDVVYNFFDNLLPDSVTLRTRIRTRFNIGSDNCFDLLSYIGSDCVGALRLLPLSQELQTDSIEAQPLNKEKIFRILENYQNAPLGMQKNTDFRISIAGAQEKTAFLKKQGKWYLPKGSTPTTHIFKLPIGKIQHYGIDLTNSIENEWLCLQILSEFNLVVNKTEIHKFNDINVLVCERFDRKWNETKTKIFRLPQEDMCQVFGLPSAMKYESEGGPGILQIMDFLNGSFYAQEDRANFFKTCMLFWIMGAIDGHAKNHSIFINEFGRFCLTPIYDVLSIYPIVNDQQIAEEKIKMAMGVRGKNKHYHWKRIQIRHWEETAHSAQLSKNAFYAILETVFDSLDPVIDSVSSRLPTSFSESIASSIFNGMKKIKNKKSIP